MSGGETNCPCITQTSTIFVFSSPAVQNAANSVYESKKARAALGRPIKFKSDSERMQYVIGRQGRLCNPPTTGGPSS